LNFYAERLWETVMSQFRIRSLILAGAAAMVLAACNGGRGSAAPETPFTSKAAKGAIFGAACTVTSFNGQVSYGTASSNAEGLISFTLVGELPEDEALLVTCAPAAGATYFNEATGTTLPLPAPISAVISSLAVAAGNGSIAVTPLTNLAALQLRAASNAAGGAIPNAAAASNANTVLAQAFGLSSITALPPTVNATSTGISDPYSLLLAAIAQAAATSGVDPFAFVSSLVGASPSTIDGIQTQLVTALDRIAQTYTVPAATLASVKTAVQNAPTTIVVPVTSGS